MEHLAIFKIFKTNYTMYFVEREGNDSIVWQLSHYFLWCFLGHNSFANYYIYSKHAIKKIITKFNTIIPFAKYHSRYNYSHLPYFSKKNRRVVLITIASFSHSDPTCQVSPVKGLTLINPRWGDSTRWMDTLLVKDRLLGLQASCNIYGGSI